MLPGIGFSEMLLIGVLAIVVIGPKDLPMMLRKLGQWVAKLRLMATDFRSNFEEMARETELDNLRREVEALRQEASRPLQRVTDYLNTGIEDLTSTARADLVQMPKGVGDHDPVTDPAMAFDPGDTPPDGPPNVAEASDIPPPDESQLSLSLDPEPSGGGKPPNSIH